MSAFTPTLRLEVTEEEVAVVEAAGSTVEESEEDFARFFRNASVTDGLRFTAENITVIETGQTVQNFQSGVAAIFEIDGVVHLKLSTGDVVAIKLHRV